MSPLGSGRSREVRRLWLLGQPYCLYYAPGMCHLTFFFFFLRHVMLPLSLPHKLYSSFSQVLCSQDCLMRCSSHRLHTLSLILSLSLSLFICLPVLFRLKVCCLWLSMAIHKCICKPHSLPLSSNTCSSLSSTLCQIYLSFSPDLSIRSNVKQQDRAQRLNTLCFAFFF